MNGARRIFPVKLRRLGLVSGIVERDQEALTIQTRAYGLESIFPTECEIPSLKLAFELLPDTSSLKECLVHLEHLDE